MKAPVCPECGISAIEAILDWNGTPVQLSDGQSIKTPRKFWRCPDCYRHLGSLQRKEKKDGQGSS